DAVCASGTARHRVQTIDNGIDGARFGGATATLRHELGIDDKLVIGAVGRLTPQKGFDHLARAAAEVVNEFSDAVFVVIGEGPERARLEQLTRDLGLSGRFILAGRRSDMAGAYASMDVFVLSSIDEGMPMVVLEAQAAARPVVATRVAAVPKLVTHEQTGILVQPGDAAALRAGIVRLL